MAFKLNQDKVNQAKQQADAKNTSFGPSTKWFRFDGSKAKLRFMPPWTGDGDFGGQPWRVVAQHWNVSEESKGPILCPKNTPHLNGECPICDFVDMLKARTDDVEAKELVNDIRFKQAYLFSVVDLSDAEYTAKDVAEWKKDRPDKDVPFEAGDPKVQVYAAPFTVYNAILSILQSGGDIFDLEAGHDVTIEKNGKGKHTKYTVTPALRPTKSNVAEDYELADLSKVGIVHDTAKLRELLENGVGGAFDEVLPSAPVTKSLPKAAATSKPTGAKATASKQTVKEEVDEEDEDLALGEDEEDDDLEDLEKRMMGDD